MKLKDSREATQAAIERQIKKGQDEFLSGKVESAPHFGDALGELETICQTWNTHNIALLKAKFDDDDVLREYNPKFLASTVSLYGGTDLIQDYEELKERVRKKIAILQGLIGRLDLYEERPMYRASGGRLDAFHAKVIEVSGQPLKDANLRAAVMDAFIALDSHVQAKSGRSDLNGTGLMQTVFSGSSPILRLSTNTEEQTGFMNLFVGAVKAIRNQYAHNVVSPATEQEAMEWLAFASALFRLVDRAEVV